MPLYARKLQRDNKDNEISHLLLALHLQCALDAVRSATTKLARKVLRLFAVSRYVRVLDLVPLSR